MLVCWDTETTGLPLWKEPSEHPGQPHIVQLAAARRSLVKEEAQVDLINRIIKPDGYVIPDDMAKLHGITTERAMDEGVPINDVIDEFYYILEGCTRVVGFNLPFDIRMLRIAEKRRYPGADDAKLFLGLRLEGLERYDLAPKMTPHCNLPPSEKMMAAGRKTAKTPKLIEAFRHCYGKDPEGRLHDAMTDVKASMGVYWWLQENGRDSRAAA